METLIYKEECYKIVGACFAVYNAMGCCFLEAVYQECMEIEFDCQGVPFTAQPQLKLLYRDRELKQRYIPDAICYDKIIVELKAVSNLADEHRSQVLNYLNATGMKLGILVNFGHNQKVEYERIVL
ncbi:MAG: GxxExxY protein [Spartobacteria bacterium]|nr:GxxExxY protein [Spartobacteria bacterium]